MTGIALAGFLLGHLADRIGRKPTIIAGLTLFAAASYMFIAGNSFWYFCALMALSGAAIGIFKTAALALIGDIVTSTKEHTSIMNMVEGFFGVGSILGPAILARLLIRGLSWQWLYVIAGTMCVLLIITAALVRYPAVKRTEVQRSNAAAAIANRYILAFSLGAFLYVAVESAVYVWMPTLIAGYHGSGAWLAAYSISIFFLLRAAGRFLGSWMLNRFQWTGVPRSVFRPDPGVLCRQRYRGRRMGRLLASAVGPVHVGDLSDHQFQRHQLPAEIGTWRGRRRNSVFHLSLGSTRTSRHGRDRR